MQKSIPAGSRILDVECFDGGFLKPVVSVYRYFGTEILSAAGNRAKGKGRRNSIGWSNFFTTRVLGTQGILTRRMEKLIEASFFDGVFVRY